MAVFKYLNPNYVEDGSEPKWIKIPLTGSAVITPVQSTGQSEVDVMSQKAVTDALNTKQNTLVSGTNIKTINDETILGNGNISIEVPDVSNFVTEVEVDQKISSLVASAPEALDTLKELADALGNDANFATTITNQLANKVDTSTYNQDKETFATKTEVQEAVSSTTFNTGHNSVTSVTSIPITKRLVVATISTDGSFSLANTPEDGQEVHIIVHNTSTSDINITMPSSSSYINMSGDTLTVAASSYADINVLSDGTNMYVRAL